MARLFSPYVLLIGAAGLAINFSGVAAQPGYAPVLQDAPELWQHPFGGIFPPTNEAAPPTWQDPSRRFVSGRTWHIADLSNPNLKEWAKDVLKKEIADLDAGKLQFSPS